MKKEMRDMLGRTRLLEVDEAIRILAEALPACRPSAEEIPLSAALHRITAAEITAPEDLPPFPRATMDGYAVVAGDTFGAGESSPCWLTVSGEVMMGSAPEGRVNSGSCWKIPTGGVLPAGADAVVMLEKTIPVSDTMIEVIQAVGCGTDIIQPGEDVAAGATVVPANHRLRPQDLALLAAVGINSVRVRRKPRVAILSTGDELVPADQTPAPGQIRDINSIALTALAAELGAEVSSCGIVDDRDEAFLSALSAAAAANDLVLFSGGSSVGTRDPGERALKRLGPPGILVHGVKLKPGKPVLIAIAEQNGLTPIFGLPGHPVSAMVCFELFVRPTLAHLAGAPLLPRPSLPARLSENINSAPGRRDVVRVRLSNEDDGWHATPIHGRSGAISTLSRACGWFFIDEAAQGVAAGEMVDVILL